MMKRDRHYPAVSQKETDMRCLIVAPVLALAAVPGTAHAQFAEIAAGATMGSIVDQLEGSVRNIINNADDAVSNNSFRIRQQGEVLLGQLNAMVADQRDKTFAQLNESQKQAFLGIRNSIAQLSRLERVTARDIQRTTNTVGTAMGNLPFGKSTPRVIEYGPTYILGKPAGGPATREIVSVSGIALGEGTPQLKMQGVQCQPLAKTEISLKFACPGSWSADAEVKAASGELQVYQKPGFWRGLFGARAKPRSYKLSVFVVPPELGKYDLSVIRKVLGQEENSRSQDFRSDNGHCDGNREVLFPFNVTPGWRIDPASIRVNCDTSSRSSCSGLRNVTATSFGYLGVVRNSGSCGRTPFGNAWVDARGNVRGRATWTEVREIEKIVTEPVGQGGLEWAKAVQLPIPEGVQRISLTVNQLDGKRTIVTGDDATQRWYAVQSDPVNRFVLVSPRTLDEAMGD
ncbi:hypothetical protein J2W22_001063 [Sphingomonas kyeonggiensis]|nr:hypothetical protein [Sphingomonas kyeonggiensis]